MRHLPWFIVFTAAWLMLVWLAWQSENRLRYLSVVSLLLIVAWFVSPTLLVLIAMLLPSMLLAWRSKNRWRSLIVAGVVMFLAPPVGGLPWALHYWRTFGRLEPKPAPGWVADTAVAVVVEPPRRCPVVVNGQCVVPKLDPKNGVTSVPFPADSRLITDPTPR
jgi:hypothetical protein